MSHDEIAEVPQRRAGDPMVKHLHECVEELKAKFTGLEKEMKANTQVTTEVKDILVSFKMFGTFAKWFSYVAAGVTAGVALFRSIKGG